ncbi:hypothetical protein Acr_22g0003050 [Actinidia rufa]|uniref:Retrotransposon gag domain-containing protein n=1 Tax=Actinidia rufa TaxID=165716 RepID=A0A7J0GJC0_9ERIC|nr:hypothetical protein Acr_22g0003050 [Actinidia rufa]
MPPRNAQGRTKSLIGARGARGARGTRRNHDEEDDGNHQESVMGGGASALGGHMGGAPSTVLGGAEFMQRMFIAIEQVLKNTTQTMQVPVRTAESRATTAMKAFLQLRPPTFKGEPDPLVVEDWLEQVTRALDTILVIEEDLRVLFASYQLQEDALQWWKTMEEVTEEEKVKQFMQGLRSSIRNKIVGNLIKVYSTIVSSAAAIEETLNETRKIQNPKSQREGTSNQSKGRSYKKPRNSTTQQQYPTRLPTDGSAAAVAAEGTISHPGIGTIPSQGATYLFSVWSAWSYQSTVHAEGEQSRSYGIAITYSVSSSLEGHSSIYISTDFISVQTTDCSPVGSKDARMGLRYYISSGTVGDSRAA